MKRPPVTAMSTQAVVFIRSYEEKELVGNAFSEYYQRGFSFENTVGLLEGLESLCDTLSFPQSSVRYRSFAGGQPGVKSGKKVSLVGVSENGNAKASFMVHVQFRQNATWQGSLQWLEEGKQMNFRSVLEMLKLMDEALEEADQKLEQQADKE